MSVYVGIYEAEITEKNIVKTISKLQTTTRHKKEMQWKKIFENLRFSSDIVHN